MGKTVFWGGPILTMTWPLYAQAVLTAEGRIQAVGSRAAVAKLAGRDAEWIDLEGRALLPAFLDPHSHFSGCANACLQGSVADAKSWGEMESQIQAYIRQSGIPAGQWVLLRDLDPELLAERRPPDRAMLDRAAPEHPVVLQHKSGHVGVLNSRALERLGITGDTPDPEGGRIWKEGGQPTGYLEENAWLHALRQIPGPDEARLLTAYEQAQRLYASQGIATVQEGMLVKDMIPLYQRLQEQDRLWLDVVGYPSPEDGEAAYQAFPRCGQQYRGHLKLGGYKIFLDGSPQSRTAWMRTPYQGGEDRGYPVLSDGQVAEAVSLALATGRQLLAHCNGDQAAEQYLRALEAAREEGHEVSHIRPVMIHAQLVGRDQLPRMAALGVIPSFFVAHVYHWGEAHIRNFGLERASAISPAASAGRWGLPYTFHQDAPVIRPDMLETLWCAVCRRTREGTVLGAEERVSVLDALRAVTAHAAAQYGETGCKGVIAPGARADLVLLDRDPLTVEPEALRSLQVLETYKDGLRVYRR